ncbi:MAG TPA: YjfB family protein [Noviherbaspirillum sp.]|jgi:hypothetical protein|uniref:YjfB family protein n=1 Tax=Noviherbaspirillum sp. TaxID=1926288 RepID=UPI002DDD8FEF|nr:YjfB family protein [Noviherbaspirillum sp.]HEV2610960.1 YjfB family protein [Noviherbaspirillum sp.]
METGNIAALATTIASTTTNQAIGIAVAKKAMEIQETNALALVQALPAPTPNLPPHLGRNIDTTA